MAKKKKQIKIYQKYVMPVLIGIAIVLAMATVVALYAAVKENGNGTYSAKNKSGYVDGHDAVHQVSEFYRLYPAEANSETARKALVSAFGDDNLVFYSQYYQHGFDPMTCSTIMPTKVAASLISAGPVAIVKAHATYPDGMIQDITVRVTVNTGLAIDSITCPGKKGNLPPLTSNL